LDNLLKKKADEGVKIYVVVYQEVEEALTLNSNYSKTCLQKLHKDIVVQRHPNHLGLLDITLFWAHHEKICVIDNRIAFIGGLDLCFGRWDTHDHILADFHPVSLKSEVWVGQDYSNPRIKDFEDVEHWEKLIIDKRRLARMPWHDVSIGVIGQPVLDIARHFIQRWNFIKQEKSMDREEVILLEHPALNGLIELPTKLKNLEHHKSVHHVHHTANVQGNMKCQVLRSSAEWSTDVPTEHSIQNAYIQSIIHAEHFIYIENQFFITATDDDEKNVIKNQIGKAIVDRIIRAHHDKQKFRVIVVMPLVPCFPAELSTKDAATVRLIMHWQYASISRGGKSVIDRLKAAGIDNPEEYITFFSLRSYDRINHTGSQDKAAKAAGVDAIERETLGAASEQETKGRIIKDAEPEFVHGTEGSESFHNPLKSIQNKLENSEKVTIPSESQAELLKIQDEVYAKQNGRVKNTIAACALLGGDVYNETWLDGESCDTSHDPAIEAAERQSYVTEELYIHTKVLIVDDRKVICGSANLNDRSQCGDHDSEIAMIIEDQDLIDSKMKGQPYKVSRFATSLRRQLFREHLGLIHHQDVSDVTLSMHLPTSEQSKQEYDFGSNEDLLVEDPLSDEFYSSLWWQTAETNTTIFRDLFHPVPDDGVTTWDEYKKFFKTEPNEGEVAMAGHIYSDTIPVKEIREKLAKIRGHLVHFPTHFLEKVDLLGESVLNKLTMELYT